MVSKHLLKGIKMLQFRKRLCLRNLIGKDLLQLRFNLAEIPQKSLSREQNLRSFKRRSLAILLCLSRFNLATRLPKHGRLRDLVFEIFLKLQVFHPALHKQKSPAWIDSISACGLLRIVNCCFIRT